MGVMARPWNLPEFVWAIAGAAMLVLFHLLPWKAAAAAAGEGAEVYRFLIGMMSRSLGNRGCSTGSRSARSGMRAAQPNDYS